MLGLDAPFDDRARRFAHAQLLRTRPQPKPDAGVADLAARDVLADEDTDDSILHRDDTLVRASRVLRGQSR